MKSSLLISRIRLRRATVPVRRRVPKQAHPLNIEREYARMLSGMMATIHAKVMATIPRMFDSGIRRDADPKGIHNGPFSNTPVNRRMEPVNTTRPSKRPYALVDPRGRVVSNHATLENAKTELAKYVSGEYLYYNKEADVVELHPITELRIAQISPDANKGETEIPSHAPTLENAKVTTKAVEQPKPDETVPKAELPKRLGAVAEHTQPQTALNAIRIEAERTFTAERAGLVAQGIGLRTSKFNKVAMGDQIKGVIGVDPIANLVEPQLPGIMDAFVADNISLIESIPERYFSEVHALVGDAVSTGARASDVAAHLQARFNVSESRASLIARDQVSKLNSKLTETRQKSLGIDQYRWRTSNDERVRDSHAALEGSLFSWSSPPSVGHPGEDFQCRCRAEPDLSALLGD